jgi:hypothetical protein
LDSSYYVDVVDMDGNGTNNDHNIHSHQSNNNNNNISHHHHHTRQKRVRTSFKHHQLRCMRSYFNLNHNPGWIYFILIIKISFLIFRCKRFKKSC